MRVTMIENVRSEDGLSVLAKGAVYTVSDSFGRYLCDAQPPRATDTDGALRRGSDQLSIAEVATARALVSGSGNLPVARMVGDDMGQPASITRPVSSIGKLACRFGSGQWTATSGAPTLTQGYTGWDGAGNKTGIVSRTGQPDMLKVVPAANTSEAITLGTFATNMLVKSLNGLFGLWVYLEKQPGYSTGNVANLAGTLEVALTTNGTTYTNALNVGFNNNQLREGWNFLVFRMRDPSCYLAGASTAEDHPYGIYANANGTGADSNIVGSPITAIRILWTNMLGSGADAGTALYFDSIWTGFSATPQIVLGCDQGPLLEEIAVPMFDQYGWGGYLAFPYNTADSGATTLTVQSDLSALPSTTQLAQMQRLYAKGWDVINHTVTHPNTGQYTAEANTAYQLGQARALWYGNDFSRGAEFYASPGSNTSRLSESVIKGMGFKIQRHARKTNTQVTPWGVDNPQHIGAFGWGSNASPCVAYSQGTANGSLSGNQKFSSIKRAVDVIVAYQATGHCFWHGITSSGDSGGGEDLTGDNLLITASAITKALAYIRSLEQAGTLTVSKGMTGWYYGSNL